MILVYSFIFLIFSIPQNNIDTSHITSNVSNINLGKLEEQGQNIDFEFFIENKSEKKAVIKNICSSCRCVSLKAYSTEVQPHGKTIIKGVFDNTKQGKQLPQNVYVFFSDPAMMVKVKITGD